MSEGVKSLPDVLRTISVGLIAQDIIVFQDRRLDLAVAAQLEQPAEPLLQFPARAALPRKGILHAVRNL